MGVGLRLKRILRDRKMTIKQLAENANIPVNTLYSITKRDSERVDPVILRQLSETLEVPTSVLTGHGTPPDEAAEYAERMTPPEVMEDFKKAVHYIPLGDGSIGLFRIRAETEEETERIRKEFFRIVMNPLMTEEQNRAVSQRITAAVQAGKEKKSAETQKKETSDNI